MPAPQDTRTPHGSFEDCACERCRRAHVAWQQRDQLAQLARRRTNSWVDAEDAAQEAIVRALEAPELDLEQLPAWLTRVALNLCADIGRDQRRHHKRVRYQVMHQPTELDAETVVVERVYARAMYDIAQELPAAQRAALLLKAEGHTIGEVAEALAISDKAAESLLSRARAALRRAAGAFIGAAAIVLRRARRTAPQLVAGATAASSILILAPATGAQPASHALSLSGGAARDAVRVSLPPATATIPHAEPAKSAGPGDFHLAAPRPALVAPRDVTVGPAGVHDGGEGWKHSDETLVQSARECVDQGVVITAQYVGCKAAQQSAPSAR